MEAMLSGLPCVVTDAGGNRELVVHDTTGFVCAPTTQALHEGVLRLLDDQALPAFLLRHPAGRAGLGTGVQPVVDGTDNSNPVSTAWVREGRPVRPRPKARAPGPASGTMKPIACLVGSFPTLTETFIVGEILELRRRGIPIVVYALGRSRESILQPEALTLADEVRFAAPLWAPRLLVANARWVVRRPGRYARALGLLVRRMWRNPVHLLNTLSIVFPRRWNSVSTCASKASLMCTRTGRPIRRRPRRSFPRRPGSPTVSPRTRAMSHCSEPC